MHLESDGQLVILQYWLQVIEQNLEEFSLHIPHSL